MRNKIKGVTKSRIKAVAQVFHARKRARERYGLQLSREDYEDAILQVRSGKGRNPRKITNRLTEFIVTVQGLDCRIVYDRNRHTIATFLPSGEGKD